MARKSKLVAEEVPRYQIGWAERNNAGDLAAVVTIDVNTVRCVFCGDKISYLNGQRTNTPEVGKRDRLYFFYHHVFCKETPTQAHRFEVLEKLSELIEQAEAKIDVVDIEITNPMKMLMN